MLWIAFRILNPHARGTHVKRVVPIEFVTFELLTFELVTSELVTSETFGGT